jgi:hypothetical protein
MAFSTMYHFNNVGVAEFRRFGQNRFRLITQKVGTRLIKT